MDYKALGENTIIIDCDVLQADGGTRTAAVPGGYVALADAVAWLRNRQQTKGDPLLTSVSAISVGIVDGEPRLDLSYEEDVAAQTDMNVVCSASGDETVVLATRNAAKLHELDRILAAEEPGGAQIRLAGLDEFPGAPDVPETRATFEENALLKARAIATFTGLPAVADDSGLCVDALNGMPGVLSARWAGRHGDDRGNLGLVLAQVTDVPDTRLGAQFVCAAATVAAPSALTPFITGTSRR